MVITALAMFAMVAMMTFAIDVSHWFDYSRNLQNRADAAALAAGDAYGNICFLGNAGDTQTGAQSAIGKWAQLYSGAGLNEPAGNLPYTDAQVSALPSNPVAQGGPGTGWNLAQNGYINDTLPGSSLQSPLTLKAGSLSDYYLRLNADNYSTQGGTNFSHGDFCAWDPTYDATDAQCFNQPHGQTTGPCAVAPIADVKVTQATLPNFIQLFNIHPNITAHARVALQSIQSEKGVRPIAVADATYTPCVTANFLDKDTGTPIASETLKRQGTTNVWDSSADAKQIKMPSNGDPVTVQISANNCSTTNYQETLYDYYDTKGQENPFGLAYINNWGNPTAPGAGAAPALASGGVSLTGGAGITGSTCDAYFTESTATCADGVDANVAFQPNPNLVFSGANQNAFVRAQVLSLDSNSTQTVGLSNITGNDWNSGLNTFAVLPDSGIYTVSIQWAQTVGTVGGQTCKLPGNNNPFSNGNPCNGTIAGPTVNGQANVLQRTFAGINGTNACNNPNYDTGPVQWVDVGTTDAPQTLAGENAFGNGGSALTPHLYVTASIQGLVNAPSSAGAADDICLRVAVQTQHATGFVDCGQGNGGGGPGGDISTIINGCPVPPGLQKNVRVQADGSLTCTPTITPWDCVGNDPGNSPPVLKGFDQLIGQGNAPGNCSGNNWPNVNLTDPRALVMIITAPVDLQNQNGAAGQTIPVRDFAVFYVTGWSSKVSGFPNGGVKGCNNNDPAPNGAVDGELWGHWTSVAVPSGLGTGNGQQCNTNSLGNCIAVLTR